MKKVNRRRIGLVTAAAAAATASVLAVRRPGNPAPRRSTRHSTSRAEGPLAEQERTPALLQIYRDSLLPGADAEFQRVEEEAARICSELGFPNPHLAIESLSGPKEIWWLNAFASEDSRTRVASLYAGNRPLAEALEGIVRRKEGLVSTPVDVVGRYRADLSHGVAWDPSGARFVVATVSTDAAGAVGAVFESPDGRFFALQPARSRAEAETLGHAAGPGARLFAVRPTWGMPAKAWVAADPEFWKSNPGVGRR